jgi:A/G-specific adenine glycosylase
MPDFAQQLIRWQTVHGRHSLPWQNTRDPYRIWLSEIMLQQTQVGTVIAYYQAFLKRFPDIASLARASQDDVLARWSGLGYYSRARNLHATARQVMMHHHGRFPEQIDDIIALPGIGRSTAAAIAAFAFDTHAAILDGNVKRVLTRHFGISGYPGEKKTETALWLLAESLLPAQRVDTYTQALMDFGATLCTRGKPACQQCPLQTSCAAFASNRVHVLPTPRPKRTLPQKSVRMLILHCNGKIMLEKRADKGIWGGLWSLPELASQLDSEQHCLQTFGLTVTPSGRLPLLRHSFTHFHLHIAPELLSVAVDARLVMPAQHDWFTPAAALAAGIPTPVRKLLQQLRASDTEALCA